MCRFLDTECLTTAWQHQSETERRAVVVISYAESNDAFIKEKSITECQFKKLIPLDSENPSSEASKTYLSHIPDSKVFLAGSQLRFPLGQTYKCTETLKW